MIDLFAFILFKGWCTNIEIENHINHITMPNMILDIARPYHIGKQVTFNCKTCGKRVFEPIKDDCSISCSICGFVPKPKQITLSMPERRKLVDEMFAPDTDLSDYLLDLQEYYSNGIDQIYSHEISKKGTVNFYRYYGDVWQVLDGVASYILNSPDTEFNGTYSERGLNRKQYRMDRKTNCYTFSMFQSNKYYGDNKQYTAEEIVDYISYQLDLKYEKWHYDPRFNLAEFMENLTDIRERDIVMLLYCGYTKTEIAKHYKLSETQLQTIIKHIGKHLLEPKSRDTVSDLKQCIRCKDVKFVSDFGADKRKNDGLQSICKECDRERKKITGILPKSA